MKKVFAIFLSFVFLSSVYSQSSSNDSTFNTFDAGQYGSGGGMGQVTAIALQTDGKIIFGCIGFSGILNSTRIVRLNMDGTIDTSFDVGVGFNNIINSIAIQDDGKIIIGGEFTSYNGVVANRLIRLNSDGTVDNTFFMGTGFNGKVNTISIFNDGKILIGGEFTNYNGSSLSAKIIRLDQNGLIDNSFNVEPSSLAIVTSAIQSDGKILINGLAKTTRLNTDGSEDLSFVCPPLLFSVKTIAIQNDGKILVGGNGNGPRIYRLNGDGSIDNSFDVGTGFQNGSNPTTINSIAIFNDGSIAVGGDFNRYKNTPSIYHFAHLDNIGNLISPSFNFNNNVNNLVIQQDNKIIVGGIFSSNNGSLRLGGYTRLNNGSSLDESFSHGSGFNNKVNSTGNVITKSIIVQPDNSILVAGDFQTFNGENSQGIVKLTPEGDYDSTFNGDFAGDFNVILLQNDGKIIAGGNSTYYSNISTNRILRLNNNGSIDNSFVTGTGFNGSINTGAIQPDGKIILGGNFTSYNGQSINRIIRLDSSGNIDFSFNPGSGFNSDVNTITLQEDGKILVGGSFTNFNGVSCNYIVRLHSNGMIDNTFNDLQINSTVWDIKIQNDDQIVIGGAFTTPTWRLLRSNPDGTIDLSFTPNTQGGGGLYNGGIYGGDVKSLQIDQNGRIIVVGDFTDVPVASGGGITYNPRMGIALINSDGSLNQVFNPGSGFGQATMVTTCELQIDGKILVGGNFSKYNNIWRNRIVRIIGECQTSAPNGTSLQTFCNNASIEDLAANGTQIQWYSNAYGGTALSLNTPLTNNTTYYASQTINYCESETRFAVTVNIDSTAAPIGAANQTYCNGAMVMDLVANGTQIQWYSDATGGTALSSNTILLDNAVYFGSQILNNCESESRLAVTTSILPNPNNSVTNSNNTLTSDQLDANYQWLDCDNNFTPILDADQISFIATQSGNYAVLVSLNDCETTSDCYYVEINSMGNEDIDYSNPAFNLLFPNPNNGIFTFETRYFGNYYITNNIGQILSDFEMNSEKKEIQIPNLTKGVYYILPEEGVTRPIKFIVK